MRNRLYSALLVLTLACLVGCEEIVTVRMLPQPEPDIPTCNLPLELRQKNWLGRQGQGSCVYASLVNHVRWLNLPELADKVRRTYGDGEYETRLKQNLDHLGVKYASVSNADPRFLDWCDIERRGAILWWKPSHCCTFVGWVTKPDGRQYAAILDNNRIEGFELTEREQFIRLWAGYGGFALCVLNDPANHIPYRSYELVSK